MECDRCFGDPCDCVEEFNTLAADEDAVYVWHEVVRPHLEEHVSARADEMEEWFEFLEREGV
jgi:hypothetical protein